MYIKLYTITHGEVLFDHVEGNCIVVITKISDNFTEYLKLDELGRLSEHGQTVLFPSKSGTWDDFDITKIEINSPFYRTKKEQRRLYNELYHNSTFLN